MTGTFRELPELRHLLDALCEESITAEQLRRLEELVLTYPEAEAFYVQFMNLHADLVGHFGLLPTRSLRDRASIGQEEQAGRQGDKETRRKGFSRLFNSLSPRLLVSLSALAAGILLVLALWHRPRTVPSTPSSQVPEATDETVAVLLQAPGAEWDENGLAPRAGAPLLPGWLRLKSGFAHLEFYSGATVILEGPAEFQLISRTEAYCAQGKLRATVPPQAQGFTIRSPKLDLVDRGTEFGLQVGAGGKTEVHVFQGKVELYDASHDPAAPGRELTTGRSLRLDGPGASQPIKSNPAAFRTAADLVQRSRAETLRRQQEWLTARAALQKDPSLVVYYTFQTEHPWSRTLLDQAKGPKESHDGAIVGCSWVTGRWDGKRGLEFKRVSHRVRFHVPGSFDSLTLMAWVRVDSLPNLNNSLMMADGWKEGGCHWQIGEDGTLILGVQSRPRGHGAHYHARGAFTPKQFGHWVHLAVVYDQEGGQVSHYVDGRPVAQVPIQFDIPLCIGDAELGNWNIATHRNPSPVRYLNGCMDEFLLFSRALSEQEVEKLYTQGRPPQ
jgi:hypothetical protein